MWILRIKERKERSVKLISSNKILYFCRKLTAVRIWLETPRPRIFLTEKNLLSPV